MGVSSLATVPSSAAANQAQPERQVSASNKARKAPANEAGKTKKSESAASQNKQVQPAAKAAASNRTRVDVFG